MKFSVLKYYPTSLLFGFLLIVTSIQCYNSSDKNITNKGNKGEGILTLLLKGQNDSLDLAEKKQALELAYKKVDTLKSDSLKLNYLFQIASQSDRINDSVLFSASNKKALHLAKVLKDTFKIADIQWNYGAYYLKHNIYDSSYYHYREALREFQSIENFYFAAKMRYNMALIQSRFKDYTGAEVLLFQAISTFKLLDKSRQLYQCYNLLGIIYEEMNEYDNSLQYHQQALLYLNRLKNKTLFLQDSQNNIGIIYQKKGDYNKAMSYFNKALEMPDLKVKDPYLYARLIDNRAYTKFLAGDTTGIPLEFYTALHIRDSINNTPGIIMSRVHLADYYKAHGDTAMALYHAEKSYDLAKEIKNNRDILQALELLAGLNPLQEGEYLQEHIKLNKNLQARERNTRNKFTRIQYETDQYIAKNKQLNYRQSWIIVTSIILILFLILLYWGYRQKSYNKLLVLETEQQKANEQIYLLSLKQQEKHRQGRNQERIRISEELHDGILSDLFALRIGWGNLDLTGSSQEIDQHQLNQEELQRIETKIRALSHELRNKSVEYPLDFIIMVEKLVNKRCKIGKLQYELENDPSICWKQVDDLFKVNLYRIIEESLQNCIKHANATMIRIAFSLKEENKLQLIITDNGKGIKNKHHSGIGLKNIQSRVQKMKGSFRISSSIQGTEITIIIRKT